VARSPLAFGSDKCPQHNGNGAGDVRLDYVSDRVWGHSDVRAAPIAHAAIVMPSWAQRSRATSVMNNPC
jgi:hypothetical protein